MNESKAAESEQATASDTVNAATPAESVAVAREDLLTSARIAALRTPAEPVSGMFGYTLTLKKPRKV